ncbi:PTS N-acetylgalactosamine transporter subunit IIA [Chitiniphilus shinanonensis]|uniref:PTS N-acetylgalactosamine transporter subunit IIA n=1 Tax=Chitiniphilus shinanonensis TaxID=553088 RepID=A0ABQ6BSY2_9NEIS|nr:PTS galactosamine/N-acetylgalactosamine transporter subunit IIA [Chitiniphilus shinanonensis]GLS04709.1 PTS N-acetylgalactosamine transporter subunit IIA [Chitiniphilus shinanonensis]
MISLILTGHGRIASGIHQAIVQVFGPQDALHVIDFPEGVGTAELERQLSEVLDQCDGDVVFFTDLLGGSPFRLASTLATERSGTEVIAGMNLAMFAEMLFERDSVTDAAEFRARATEAGRSGITSLAERLLRTRPQLETASGL